ncbi:MAG: BrnA antitoxin family protein [Treponema sp.]|uniref:BrnA antitoxin family protein n=1 Tax=Treponema sp. TaxID=166 RepID=UPI003FA2F5F1
MKQMQKEYKIIDFPPLTEEQKKELELLDKMPDNEIDLSDCPETDFSNGHFYYIQSSKMPKTSIHAKIDNDNLAWLKKDGNDYQARLNNVIRWARFNNCPITQM